MPLSPELRNLRDENGDLVYRGPVWAARRARLIERAGNKCERCRVPNHKVVTRKGGWWWDSTGIRWCGPGKTGPRVYRHRDFPPPYRRVSIVLTMAHLTHDPLRNDDADLAMLCQWCHLHYDRNQHRETRVTRKDAARPLLASAGVEA